MNPLRKLIRELYGIWQVADRRSFQKYLLCMLMSAREVIPQKSLLPADRRMRGTLCRFSVGGGKTVVLDGQFFGGARELYVRRAYFSLPGFEIRSNDVVVDVGANVGVFTVAAATCGSRVLAIEAQSQFIPIIEANLKQNGCREKVALECALIGSREGVFSRVENRHMASHWGQEPAELALDDLVNKHGLERIDFLKLDIEGSEFDLFRDGGGWLEKVRRIAMEVHPEFGDAAWLRDRLTTAGFRVWLMDLDQRPVSALGARMGYLFARRERDVLLGPV